MDKDYQYIFDAFQKNPKEKKYTLTKRGKVTIFIFIASLILISFAFMIPSQIEIDCFKNFSIKFTGYDGLGNVEFKNKDIIYNGDDEEVKNFLKTIKFKAANISHLSNGDKIKIETVYSKDKAKDLNIIIKKDYQTYTVKGLKKTFQSAKDIDKDLYQQALNQANKQINDKDTFYKAYYSHENSQLIFVYIRQYQYWDLTEESKYIAFNVTFNPYYDINNEFNTHILDISQENKLTDSLKELLKVQTLEEVNIK